jgi:hypothetical protein
MFPSIAPAALARVSGGSCPLYKSSRHELERRRRAGASGRRMLDEAWAQTWAGLSDDRKAEIRQKALDHGAADPCRANVEPQTLAVEQFQMLRGEH